METVFHDFKTTVEYFFDDATTHSMTIEDNWEQIRLILQRLGQVNLKLNFTKCKFFETEIVLFGHTITQGIIKMNQDKLQII